MYLARVEFLTAISVNVCLVYSESEKNWPTTKIASQRGVFRWPFWGGKLVGPAVYTLQVFLLLCFYYY